MRANEEDQILTDQLGLVDKLRKLIGIHASTAGIEEDLSRTPVFREKIEARRQNLALGALAVTCSPFHEFGRDRVRMRVARLTDEVNVNLQRPTLAWAALERVLVQRTNK